MNVGYKLRFGPVVAEQCDGPLAPFTNSFNAYGKTLRHDATKLLTKVRAWGITEVKDHALKETLESELNKLMDEEKSMTNLILPLFC